MGDLNAALPAALRRALELLAEPPTNPDVSKGYLDLLGTQPVQNGAVPKNTGAIQAVWASPVGSMLYDNTQAVVRKLFTAWQQPIEWLNIPPGGIALDVGCGPGNVTASLARATGPDGLALGVDISEPMLARAVRAEAGPQDRLPAGGRAAAPAARRDGRCGGLDRRAAADTGPDSGASGDGAGASTGRTTGCDGAHCRACRQIVAETSERRGLSVRRRRTR